MVPFIHDISLQEDSQDDYGGRSLVEVIANSIIDFSKGNHQCTSIDVSTSSLGLVLANYNKIV